MTTSDAEQTIPNSDDLRQHRRKIEQEMGGVEKVEKLRRSGRKNVRERIATFCDPGSFVEVGTFALSERPEDRDTTPGDGKIGGHGRVDGRTVTVVGDDITVKRGTSSVVGELKVERLFEQAMTAGNPFVFFGEAGGARIPDIMQVETFAKLPAMPWLATRRRRIPTATAIVGESFGASSLLSSLTDFVVQVRGSCLAIASPRVIEIATGEQVTMDELGGVDVHDRHTAQIDLAVDSEDEARDAMRHFIGLLPPNAWTRPGRTEPPQIPATDGAFTEIVPQRRRRAYDMRVLLRALLDHGELLELQGGYGRSLVTGLGRLNGFTVGVLASQPMYQAGALSPDACDKATRLICLCDAFDIPLVFLQDTPGFLVGRQVEHARLLHRASRLLQALALCGSPRLTVIIRKSYGMAFQALNGTGMGGDAIYAWPRSEIGFMDPDVAANVIYAEELKGLEGDDREDAHRRLVRELTLGSSPFDAAGAMAIDEMIEPERTRAVLAGRLEELASRQTRSLDERHLRSWSTC